MRTHKLKTWPEPFEAVVSGKKTHEVRFDDRGFAVGDYLELREYDPSKSDAVAFTGRACLVEVTYLSAAGTWGLPRRVCVMSIVLLIGSKFEPKATT